MGIFDEFTKYLTENAKKDGFRLWVGKTGNQYIKKGGNGRKGPVFAFFNVKKNK
ncbi:hypothetical protein [Flavobacterium psychrophilum]|uniref:hypothetical protein n=1 Tax=Flavobacterium psychrophilum TaxID=96345 RepID=UPI00141B9E78|nr:hypothetical protein [Flavobacterium psychrophilum]